MRRRTQLEFESAMSLMETGRGDSEIARLTGTPRETVSAWRHGRGVSYHQRVATAKPSWRPREACSYSYLLGVYLGDGWIHVSPRGSAVLVVTLDSTYPDIVAEVARAVGRVFTDTPVRRFLRMGGSVTAVQINHPVLPFASLSTAMVGSTIASSRSPIGNLS